MLKRYNFNVTYFIYFILWFTEKFFNNYTTQSLRYISNYRNAQNSKCRKWDIGKN